MDMFYIDVTTSLYCMGGSAQISRRENASRSQGVSSSIEIVLLDTGGEVPPCIHMWHRSSSSVRSRCFRMYSMTLGRSAKLSSCPPPFMPLFSVSITSSMSAHYFLLLIFSLNVSYSAHALTKSIGCCVLFAVSSMESPLLRKRLTTLRMLSPTSIICQSKS